MIRNFNFDWHFIVDGDGFSKGIWCLWRSFEWQVNIIRYEKQFVHMSVSWNNTES